MNLHQNPAFALSLAEQKRVALQRGQSRRHLASQLRTAHTGEAPRVARTANPLMAMLRLAATPEGH